MTKTRWMVLLVSVIALAVVAHAVIAADDAPAAGRRGAGAKGAKLGEGQPRARMVPPLMKALDTNGDGKLDKAEIQNATAALTALAGEDGEITSEELRPKRPEGRDGKAGEGRARAGGKAGEGRGKRPRAE